MTAHVPWWAWTIPLWPTLVAMAFVLGAGWLQRRSTGRYPTLRDFVHALLTLSPLVSGIKMSGDDDRPAAIEQQTDHQVTEISRQLPREHSADPSV